MRVSRSFGSFASAAKEKLVSVAVEDMAESYGMRSRFAQNVAKGRGNSAGLVATLISALFFEYLENSELVISMFRANTGSKQGMEMAGVHYVTFTWLTPLKYVLHSKKVLTFYLA